MLKSEFAKTILMKLLEFNKTNLMERLKEKSSSCILLRQIDIELRLFKVEI